MLNSADYHRDRYADAIGLLQEMLGGSCASCGAVGLLEFDHVDPAMKCFDITAHWNWPLERLLPELEKCQLLCGPCHQAKTRHEGSNVGGGRNRVEDPEHGTAVMYGRERCRCDLCTRWKRLYRHGLVDARGHPKTEGCGFEPRHPC